MEWAQRKIEVKYKKEMVEKGGKKGKKMRNKQKRKQGRFSTSGFEWSLSFEGDFLSFKGGDT